VHVHRLGINPRDGALYAATHTGLFTIRDRAATRVADRYQDTMGFTVVGPDHFLGSGHPDFRDRQLYDPNRRPLLGLVDSRDAARSWRSLSLLGEADFHALQWPTAVCAATTPPALSSWSQATAGNGRCDPRWR
jgi:hypothetical protein